MCVRLKDNYGMTGGYSGGRGDGERERQREAEDSLATSGCEGNRKKKKPRVCLQVCMVGAVFVAPAGQYSCARCSQPCPATTVLFCLLVMS